MNSKQYVASVAVTRVQSGMVVGLGTGSTANCFIEALAHQIHDKQWQIQAVASSTITANFAIEHGISLLSIAYLNAIDIYVDGADEVAPDGSVLKGRGGDLVIEKLLARAAKQFIVLAEESKQTNYLGEKFPIPIEVLPFAWRMVQNNLRELEGHGDLRHHKDGSGIFITSQGNYVLDTRFNARDANWLDTQINQIPGVVEHGIFCGMPGENLIASHEQILTVMRK